MVRKGKELEFEVHGKVLKNLISVRSHVWIFWEG